MSGEFFSGQAELPCILVHGGAGRSDTVVQRQQNKQKEAAEAAGKGFAVLRDGGSAADAVQIAVEHLEACPLFNAGLGAAIQSDGVARLTASFMDGSKGSFSAVSLVEEIIHPIKLARHLQSRDKATSEGRARRGRVIGPPGVFDLIQEFGLSRQSPITKESQAVWEKAMNEPGKPGMGTVGAVAVDLRGRLAAATSTGGYGTDAPGRMSDVCSVAGNYASTYAAISATGVGEQIIDSGLALRLETRVRDGMSLLEAAGKIRAEAVQSGHSYGWIALDAQGNWVSAHTTPDLVWAFLSLGK